jgi:hypothetical protein
MTISKTESKHIVNGQELLVGIDIAKQTHVAKILLANGKESRPFSQNTREGFDALISWLMECRRGLPLIIDY